jgi:hypothetical protein
MMDSESEAFVMTEWNELIRKMCENWSNLYHDLNFRGLVGIRRSRTEKDSDKPKVDTSSRTSLN